MVAHSAVNRFVFCSKLDENVDLPSVSAKEKLELYKAGDEITCFVSKVRLTEPKPPAFV